MVKASGSARRSVAWMLMGLVVLAPLAAPAAGAIVPPPPKPLPISLENRIASLRTPDAIVVPAETLPANLAAPAAGTKANLVDVDARTLATGEAPAAPPAWPPMPGAPGALDAPGGETPGEAAAEPPGPAAAPLALGQAGVPSPPRLTAPVVFAAAPGEPAGPAGPGADVVPTLPPAAAPAQVVLDAATYGACGQLPGHPVVCAPVEVPFGVPLTLDLDRDPTTGAAGQDVAVHVLPVAVADLARVGPPGLAVPGAAELGGLAAAPGLAVVLQVRVLPTATQPGGPSLEPPFATRVLPAVVWAVYSVAQQGQPGQMLVSVGADGTRADTGPPRLPMFTEARLTLQDLPRLLQGEAVASLDLAFQGPGPAVGLFATWQRTGPAPSGPTTVSARLEPVAPLDVDLQAKLDGSKAAATLTTPGRPTFTLGYDAVHGPATTRVAVVFQPLPGQLTATYEDLGGDRRRLGYDAAQVVDQVRVAYDRLAGGVRTTAAVTLDALPRHFEVELDLAASRGALHYDADAAIPRIHGAYTRTGPGSSLAATVEVRGVPRTLDVAWDSAAGTVAFDGSAPLASLTGRVSVNGGTVALADPREHVIASRQGPAMGLAFRLTGLKGAAAVDTTDGGRYAMSFQPGGQPFLGAAELDGLSARVELSALPRTITVDLRGGASCYAHVAGAPVGEVRALVERRTTGLHAAMRLLDLPARVDLCWTGAGSVAYSASSALRQVHAFVRTSTAGPAFEAQVQDLPPWMALAVDATGVRFDARSSPGAAPGSAQVGRIEARFGSAGRFLTGPPAEDHAVLRTTGTGTQADLRYTGLRGLEVTTAGGSLHAALTNSAPRRFVAGAETPQGTASLVVDQVPAGLVADVGPKVVQVTASHPVALLDADVEAAGGVLLGATVRDAPASLRLDLDPAAQTAAWTASAPVPSIVVQGRAPAGGRTWDARLELTGVPAAWDASFAQGQVRFRGVSAALGQVAAWVTNHGTATTYPGNHASVVLGANGDLDASLGLAQVALVEYQKAGSGFRTDLRMGGGGRFYLHGHAAVGTSAARADLVIDPLPTSIQVTQAGDAFTYDANANFDLHATAQLGHTAGIAAAPAAPLVRGLSARDGYGCAGSDCGKGWKASAFLQGFPKALRADARSTTFSMTEFRPPPGKGHVVLDVDMAARDSPSSQPPRARLLAVQGGIPSPVSLTLGPLVVVDKYERVCLPRLPVLCTDEYQGRSTTLDYAATGPLGSFVAEAFRGPLSARVEVSAVPASLHLEVMEGKQTSTATVAMSQGIARIFAAARAATTDATFSGGFELRDVPASVTLSFGRVTQTSGTSKVTAPGLSYTGSAAGLDLDAWVDARLMGGDASAEVMVGLVDLARHVTGTLSGTTLSITSRACSGSIFLCPPSPTGEIEVHVWAEFELRATGSGCYNINGNPNCTATHVDYEYDLRLESVVIDDLELRVTDVSSLTVKLGITSSVQGNFASFKFGWDSFVYDLYFHGEARVYQQSCLPFGGPCRKDQVGGTVSYTTDPGPSRLDLAFLRFEHKEGLSMCFGHSVEVYAKPDRIAGYTVNRITVTAEDLAAHGGAVMFIPVPAGLAGSNTVENIAEVTAASTSPLGGGLRVIAATC